MLALVVERLQEIRDGNVEVNIAVGGSGDRLRQAYADAAGQGTVVWRMGPRAQEASQEIQTLFEELLKYEHADETPDERRVENA